MRKICHIVTLTFAATACIREVYAQQYFNKILEFDQEHNIAILSCPRLELRIGGQNQCKNDKDGRVDFDERLAITDVSAGTYDAKFIDVTSRTCTVPKLKIEPGAIFSIAEKNLTSCENR